MRRKREEAGDGRTSEAFAADDLTEVAALSAEHPDRSAGAELQLVIYPWAGDAGAVILDVSRAGSQLVAKDFRGSSVDMHADTVDELISEASTSLADPSKAMIRWIRPVAGLF
ncbi:MAG TPA: hypothetical protein VF137_09000 [Candidatus Dormibacteraeota bacterium]